MLGGMPEPSDLQCLEVDGRVLIAVGSRVLFDYAAGDAGLRNIAAVTLPALGFTNRLVASLLGITEEYVCMLKGRARREGSAALTRPRGRPSGLTAADLDRARAWRAAGDSDTTIGARLKVHPTTIGRALTGVPRGVCPDHTALPAEPVALAGAVGSAEQTELELTGPDGTLQGEPGAGSEPEAELTQPGVEADLGTGSSRITQGAFAAGMLRCDPAADPVYFVDDHFVPYSGAQPVGKGWNTKRRHAQPGQDDTMLVDARGRAVVFGTGEPSGLVSTLPGVLAQLRQVLGPDPKILLGFDRGGAFPKALRACRAAGADWVTYRRAPLVEATIAPRRSWTVRDGKRISVMLADEIVELKDYGSARQLTLFEDGTAILQVLTSDLTATGASLLCWLRARWRIENMFKYAVEHNGIDRLADYGMDLSADTRKVPNPARVAARKTVAAAQGALIAAERALPQMLAGPGSPKQMNAALPKLHRQIQTATRALEQAKTDLRPIPAKIAATDLDPGAQRAHPRLERRGLQMVLRLLAFNAEAWLAEHFNAYLTDPNEYRAILRHLLRLGGQIDYTTTAITITLDRPDSPRVARALTLLAEELTVLGASLPGDRRPLTYQLTAA